MAEISSGALTPTAEELNQMHALYRQGGEKRQMAPHIVYPEPTCPHTGCGEPMQAIDFRLQDHGRAVHDPLVRAWWNDTGFAGRCPHCGGGIHFTIQSKRAITAYEAGPVSSTTVRLARSCDYPLTSVFVEQCFHIPGKHEISPDIPLLALISLVAGAAPARAAIEHVETQHRLLSRR